MNPLQLINLNPLMEKTSGRPEIVVGLIDGPVMQQHPALIKANIRELAGAPTGTCTLPNSMACVHGTFVAGILSATRDSVAPAICPDCTLLIHPVFPEIAGAYNPMPRTTPEKLAASIWEAVDAGARVLNLSLAINAHAPMKNQQLKEALDYAASRGAIVVCATGNQGTVAGSTLTQHPVVIPVTAYSQQGRPLNLSNIGTSIGRNGLGAPGEEIKSIGSRNATHTLTGTSAATPFVTGTIALLWSLFPTATSAQVKMAVTGNGLPRRRTLVPPLLDANAAVTRLQHIAGRN